MSKSHNIWGLTGLLRGRRGEIYRDPMLDDYALCVDVASGGRASTPSAQHLNPNLWAAGRLLLLLLRDANRVEV